MRWCFVPFFAVVLGCSGNNFELAEAPDAATDSNVAADTNVATDAAPIDSNVPPPDSSMADSGGADTNPVVLDALPSDTPSATNCARTGDCASNYYCKYSGCGVTTGVCAPLSPLPGPYYNPVCGCDGVTYWNKEHAYTNSVAIAHEDPCTPTERKACTGAGTTCGGFIDSNCVVQLSEASACAIGTPTGGCWRMPTGTLCGSAGGPPTLPCSGSTCRSQCEAIRAKVLFYPASCTTL
jgi:hypothetical protein